MNQGDLSDALQDLVTSPVANKVAGPSKFEMGQSVQLMLGVLHGGRTIFCKIVKFMPFEGTTRQYRVKSADESFERVVREHDLYASS